MDSLLDCQLLDQGLVSTHDYGQSILFTALFH